MKNRKKQPIIALALIAFFMAGVFLLVGCKKKSEPAVPAETKPAASVKIEQTTCPVMEGAINKNIFTEYKGEKVYFCCPGCISEFEKNPEKYIGKLPQFGN